MFATLGMDKVMGHPRGSGYVKFSRGYDAEKCVEVREGCYKDYDKMILNLGDVNLTKGDGRGGA